MIEKSINFNSLAIENVDDLIFGRCKHPVQ